MTNRQTLFTVIASAAAVLVASMLFRNNGRERFMRTLRRSYFASRSFFNVMGKQMMRRLRLAR